MVKIVLVSAVGEMERRWVSSAIFPIILGDSVSLFKRTVDIGTLKRRASPGLPQGALGDGQSSQSPVWLLEVPPGRTLPSCPHQCGGSMCTEQNSKPRLSLRLSLCLSLLMGKSRIVLPTPRGIMRAARRKGF